MTDDEIREVLHDARRIHGSDEEAVAKHIARASAAAEREAMLEQLPQLFREAFAEASQKAAAIRERSET